MNVIIGLFFTLIYLMLATFLAVWGGTHGPKLFPYFVGGFLALALAAMWWLCFYIPRRKRRAASLVLALCGIGIAVLLVAASYVSLDPLLRREMARTQELADATQVFNMQDEPLLFQDRAPVGVRLKYSMRFPDSNYFWQTPFLYAQNHPRHIIGWSVVGETFDPPMKITSAAAPAVPLDIAGVPAAPRRYVQGTVYTITMELLPDFFVLSADRNHICINSYAAPAELLQKLFTTETDTTYLITVAGSNYRAPTQNRYNLKTFYDAALQAGATPCQFQNGRITFP